MAIGIIFAAFSKALSQMGDRRFRKVFLLGIGLTLALLIAAYAALLTLLQWLGAHELLANLIGDATWVGGLINVTSLIFVVVLSVFLMVPVASAITSMFLDEVAQAVEDKHYPHLPDAPRVPFAEALRDTLSFLGLLIAANLLALVLYVLLPPFAPLIFWGLNGFLLGREYFTLAAMRRVGRTEAKALWKRHMPTLWAAGVLMAMPLSIPLINLMIPILGAATFTQIYHMLEGNGR
ncbi:EI24 domain-containing protein [Cognatishimia sp. SS12]|uniref:EI24 domain-containing protein n=1 Tax=Cognatishimia sp. SS12 TaxID=2979465 RepID=UPI00232CDB8C|nr:EI24 domain-containing protein [Cognatishimia sp. SS12]MDC0738163.1 EI24 domain-containing protein [Cognatishimia sp. SS12]